MPTSGKTTTKFVTLIRTNPYGKFTDWLDDDKHPENCPESRIWTKNVKFLYIDTCPVRIEYLPIFDHFDCIVSTHYFEVHYPARAHCNFAEVLINSRNT